MAEGGKDSRAGMNPTELATIEERKANLIQSVEQLLPILVQACKLAKEQDATIVLRQDDFARNLEPDEILLLGKFIKYAGITGVPVRILPARLL